tara:strand:+ start:30476 stop:30679 length:204 start_codon:yes stop_codon:yes gene_type:complete
MQKASQKDILGAKAHGPLIPVNFQHGRQMMALKELSLTLGVLEGTAGTTGCVVVVTSNRVSARFVVQ